MPTEWIDFAELKASISIEMVLGHYNIKLRRVNRNGLRGPCPLPTHSAKGEQSFAVNLTKNVWACQSASCVKARQGRRGGNVLDLTSIIEGCSIRDAALKLAEWFNVSSNGGGSTIPKRHEEESSSKEVI